MRPRKLDERPLRTLFVLFSLQYRITFPRKIFAVVVNLMAADINCPLSAIARSLPESMVRHKPQKRGPTEPPFLVYYVIFCLLKMDDKGLAVCGYEAHQLPCEGRKKKPDERRSQLEMTRTTDRYWKG